MIRKLSQFSDARRHILDCEFLGEVSWFVCPWNLIFDDVVCLWKSTPIGRALVASFSEKYVCHTHWIWLIFHWGNIVTPPHPFKERTALTCTPIVEYFLPKIELILGIRTEVFFAPLWSAGSFQRRGKHKRRKHRFWISVWIFKTWILRNKFRNPKESDPSWLRTFLCYLLESHHWISI